MALFGQATPSKVATSDHERQKGLAQTATSFKSKSVSQKPQNIFGQLRRLKAVFSYSEDTANVGNTLGQNGQLFCLSP